MEGFWVRLTATERRHGQDTREHALVVTVQHTTDAGEERDAKDAEILEQGRGTALAHHGLPLLQRGIVERAGVTAASSAHLEDACFSC